MAIMGTSGMDLPLSDTSLTFTRDDWDEPQSVTVTAVTDTDFADDTATLTHTPSGGDYETIGASTLPVTIRELTGVIVEPTSLTIVEEGATGASYEVVLE